MYLSGSDGDIISHHCPNGFLLQTTAGTGNDITISLIPDNICIGEKKTHLYNLHWLKDNRKRKGECAPSQGNIPWVFACEPGHKTDPITQ